MFCYDNLESMNPKRCKGKNSVLKPLTITCTACSTICSQERVYWDRFRSQDIPFLCPECIHDKVFDTVLSILKKKYEVWFALGIAS